MAMTGSGWWWSRGPGQVGLVGLVGLVHGAMACGGSPAVGGGATEAGSSGTTAEASVSTVDPDGTRGEASTSSDSGEPLPPAACGSGVVLPGVEQPPGDPEAGRWALLHEGYVACGIPYALFGLAEPLLGSYTAGAPLPGREGHNATLPHNWTAYIAPSGAEIVALNCLECHAGEFDGELIVGLGKATVDYTEDLGGMLANVPVPDIPIPGLAEMTKMAQRYQAVGDHTRTITVGTNPADKLAGVLAAHHDGQTLAWHDEPQLPIPDIMVPVDTPPWWRVAKKNALFYNGMARGDHRATMIFTSSLCTDTVEEASAILDYFDDVRAYIASIEAPSYPFAIDDALAAEGQAVFERDCACCHGTYAADPAAETFPNLLLPLDEVGTDPMMAESSAIYAFDDWFNASWYGQVGQLTTWDPFPGYVAPPLDGIWATAPFLHNGSVPTLELVLDSTRRPTWWRRVDYDSTHFDQWSLGWPYEELDHGWDEAAPDERKHVYDTTKQGHGNGGHTFGDHLDDAERRAVLEYLKTL